jgi:hypothetical protein
MKVARTCSLLAVLLAACADGRDDSLTAASSIVVDVAPPSAAIGYRESLQLSASVTGTALAAVSWTTDCGSITQTGLYTAPDTDTVCQVVARSEADTARSAAATVTVTASPPPAPAPPAGGWGAKCAAEPMRTTGTTYYACDCQSGADGNCVVGNDANAGTSASAPVRTWSKVRDLWTSMKAGDTVALCKGGRFNGDTVQGWGWANYSCGTSSTTTCIMRDFTAPWASGDEGRPTVQVTGGNSGIMVGGGPTLVDGYRILNIAFVNQTYYTSPGSVGGNSVGFSLGNNASDIEICNSVFDGFNIGVSTDLNHPSCVGSDGVRGYRRNFRGNQIINNCLDGALVNDHYSDYDGNTFDNNGHDTCNGYSHILNPSGGTTHTWYFGSRCDATGTRFINNVVTRNGMYQGHCNGSPVNLNGQETNITIENNYIEGTNTVGSTCGGIFGENSYEASGSFHGPRNTIIRRNVIKTPSTAIGLSSARNAIIEDNVIVASGNLNNIGAYGALIAIPHWVGNQPSAGSDMTSGGTVRNNTVYISGATNASDKAAIAVGNYDPSSYPTSTGFNVTGNVVYVAPGTAFGSCFRTQGKTQIALWDNNACYGASSWASLTSGTAYSYATWRSYAPAFDANSITSAPQFVNAGGGDFTPAVGSPLVGAGSGATTCTVGGVANQSCSSPVGVGTMTWAPTVTAKARDAAPDVGAYER